jgi:PAS domain S-box-containing protein
MARFSVLSAAPQVPLAVSALLPGAVFAVTGFPTAGIAAAMASTVVYITLLGRSKGRLSELHVRYEELQKQYARYRLMADTSPDVMLLKQPGGRRTYVSAASSELLGLNEEEFLSTPSEEMVHPDDLQRVAELNKNLSTSAPYFRSVHRLRHRAGHYVWVDATFRLTRTSEGEAIVLGMLRDVTDSVHKSEELQKAKAAAESANAAKSEFLANMSHEMRTPLNCIIGYSDILIEEEELPAGQKDMCVRIRTASSGLLSLINDVLDLAKVEAGVIDLKPHKFEVDALVTEAAALVRPIAEKKGLALFVDRDPDVPSALIGDDARIRQVLLNLLGNALKFTEKGNVGLTIKRLTADDGLVLVRFEVADTGIGIPETELGRLFERFVQVDGSAQRRHNGAGIGLSLSKEIVSLMGGRVGAASTLGVGSRFWFDIALPASTRDEVLAA